MKIPAFNRFVSIALLVSIAAGFLCGYFYKQSAENVIDSRNFSAELHKKENLADATLQQLSVNFRQYPPDSTLFRNTQDIAYYVYSRHGLLFWTDNQPDISSLCVEEQDTTLFVQLSNTACVYKSVVKDTLTYVALIKVKIIYPVENELLKSRFAKGFDLAPTVGINNNLKVTENNVYSSDGKFLFALTKPVNPVYKNEFAYAGMLFFFIAFALYFLLYVNSYRLFRQKFLFKHYLLVSIPFFTITALSLYFNFPSILYWSGIFSPFEYASNAFLASILHLTIATGFLFASVYLFYFRVYVQSKNKVATFAVILYPLFFLLVYFMLSGLVYHSGFSLNILHFEDISFNRIWTHFLLLLLGAGLIMLFYKTRNRFNFKKTVLFDIAGLLLTLIPGYFIFGGDIYLFAISYIVFTLALYVPVLLKKHISIYVLNSWWAFAFTLFLVWNSITLNDHKKKEKYEVFCRNILISGSSGNDAMADILLEELDEKISKDPVISTLEAQPDSLNYVKSYINQNYLRGFWNKYDVRVNTLSQNSDQSKAYDNYILTVGLQLKNTHFYSVPASFNDMAYLGIFPVENSDSLRFYMEFYPRKKFKSYSFPNLFTTPAPDIQTQLGISVAKYENGAMLYSSGNADYPENDKWIRKDTTRFNIQQQGQQKYYIYREGKNTSIVISEDYPVQFTSLLLYLFYTSVVYIVFAGLFTYIYQLSRRKWKIRIGLTAKFQYSFIALLVLSFVGIFYVSVNFIQQKYKEEQKLNIENKKKYIQKELQDMYYWCQDLSVVNQQTLNFDLQELSYKYQTDIHVFDNNGILTGSSQPLIFNKNLISRFISPRPYFHRNPDLIARERIGELQYLTGYTDFYNGDYLQIGYIAVPQFFSQVQIRTEIENFLSVIIQIYLIIIILVVLLSLFIGRQLSAPLNMLQQKLRQMRFGEKNEKIDYTLNDEIGQLVIQYNKTVDELENSAKMLAQSERESAWKTMARQIAHEINNPLTPMKLTIQQLQRTYEMSDERFDDYFKKSTRTLIEQIDNLSRIAATFSNFARMPEARFEHFDIAERLFSAVQLFANSHGEYTLHFEGNNSGIFAMADPEQITQVFNNLLKNAIQSISSETPGFIIISIIKTDTQIIINITDNGSGITEDVAQKLFTPNFTTKSTGMGLGLAISRNIVEIAGGSITFKTQTGRGSTFTVTLPVSTHS